VEKPNILLPAEVIELTIGNGTKIISRLIEKGLLVEVGEYPGTVYYPTEKLWEVAV
jgi:hypothetical protein